MFYKSFVSFIKVSLPLLIFNKSLFLKVVIWEYLLTKVSDLVCND